MDTLRGLAKWGISVVWRTLSYDKIEDVMENMDASIRKEEEEKNGRERGREKDANRLQGNFRPSTHPQSIY